MVQFLFSSCVINSFICISTYSTLVQVLTFDLLEASQGARPLHGGGGAVRDFSAHFLVEVTPRDLSGCFAHSGYSLVNSFCGL